MKILLAFDGTDCGEAALAELERRDWPPGSEVRVLSVAHPAPFVHDPFFLGAAIHYSTLDQQCERARQDVDRVAAEIAAKAPGVAVSTAVLDGAPGDQIVAEAERWGADLVLVGTHDRALGGRLLHGSVSRSVERHAPCKVEVVHR